MCFYIFIYFSLFFFFEGFLRALPQAPSAACRNKTIGSYTELTFF